MSIKFSGVPDVALLQVKRDLEEILKGLIR